MPPGVRHPTIQPNARLAAFGVRYSGIGRAALNWVTATPELQGEKANEPAPSSGGLFLTEHSESAGCLPVIKA
jgi:hypothetical protein